MKKICKHCGKEFKKKPSSKAKYCSLECMRKDPDYRKSLSDAAKRIGYKGTEKQKESQSLSEIKLWIIK